MFRSRAPHLRNTIGNGTNAALTVMTDSFPGTAGATAPAHWNVTAVGTVTQDGAGALQVVLPTTASGPGPAVYDFNVGAYLNCEISGTHQFTSNADQYAVVGVRCQGQGTTGTIYPFSGYYLSMNPSGTAYGVGRVVSGTRTVIFGSATTPASTHTFTSGVAQNYRLSLVDVVSHPVWGTGTVVSAKVWEGSTEPLAWDVQKLDATPYQVAGRPFYTFGNGTATTAKTIKLSNVVYKTAVLPDTAPAADLPGWRLVYSEDFTTPATIGTKTTAGTFGYVYGTAGGRANNDLIGYGSGGGSYTTTAGNAWYDPEKVLSAHANSDNTGANGVMDYYLHTDGGTGHPVTACPQPYQTGQTYGRYATRFRAIDVLDGTGDGYKIAFNLWPKSDVWAEGEIDPVETNIKATANYFTNYHQVGSTPGAVGSNRHNIDSGIDCATGIWHTQVLEWTPAGVSTYYDGVLMYTATDASSIPTTPHRYSLQLEGDLSGNAINASWAGHFEIDWVAVWSYVP